MRISQSEFANLKARFEKYFEAVPKQLWFAGRKDAPSPTKQVIAVQTTFDIDCSKWGGEVVSEMLSNPTSYYDRELRVAIRRMESWEEEQARIKRRKALLTSA